jgi:8-oxo-dGTP diphosphatase
MSFFRFLAGTTGIYDAVDRDCPRTDLRRNLKPDGAWLPRVGEKYPGSISFWTEFGLEQYLNSGLQEWHRSVVNEDLMVLSAESLEPLYQDEYQIICTLDHNEGTRISWQEFALGHKTYPLIDKVVAYVVRGDEKQERELLVFEHDKEWSEAGIQVPAGTVDKSESLESAALREAEEECGLSNLKVLGKLDEYVMYRATHKQFNRRHVFLMGAGSAFADTWTHKVDGSGLDHGMSFHFYWMPLKEAEYKLAGSFGSSARKYLHEGSSDARRGD